MTKPERKRMVRMSSRADLGLRIRHARMLNKLTLKALAMAAQCSESLLSRIERSQAMPSLATLHRIAVALGTNVAELTTADIPALSPITRAAERPVLRFAGRGAGQPGNQLERVLMPVRGQLLQADIHVLEAGAASLDAISHVGEEMGYVIEGQLQLHLGDDVHLLGPGDAFHFSSQVPHSYLNPGDQIARVLWVNTPATF